MPKYYEYKVCGYYLYYTSHCVIEAMHVHASDRRLTEAFSRLFQKIKPEKISQSRECIELLDLKAFVENLLKKDYYVS